MLISVDGFEASSKEQVGVGRFEVELLKEMARIDEKNSYRIYTPFTPNTDMPNQTKAWCYKIPLLHRLWSQLILPIELMIDRPKPDVFFAPVHYAPRFNTIPYVVGIMDLSFLYFPNLFKKRDLYKLTKWTAYSVKGAKAVITISQSSKNDILNTYKIDEQKVNVVYPGMNHIKGTMETRENVLTKYRIHGEYILYVGTLQPRKNISRLIDAFILLKKDLPKLKLVLVGKKGWLYEPIFEKVKESGLEDSIIFTGFVPEDELPVLYRGSVCFCLVSLYEGFGFPILEAMREGVPVVASNVSSIPEVVGDAGVLVNPNSTEDIALGIKKILMMNTTQRKSLIEKGYSQMKKFSWKKAAAQTISILEEVGHAQR